MGEGSQAAMCYPRSDQYDYWVERAEAMDMSVSEWMQSMIAAGDKTFTEDVEHDETNEQLRRQRDQLRSDLQSARQRIEQLEDELYRSEREDIRSFVGDHDGVTFDDVVRHVVETAPSRVNNHIDAMLGESLNREDGELVVSE